MERCALCNCRLTRGNFYASPTVEGRSHATKHHYIAERFFGRSANWPRKRRKPVFPDDPWGFEGETAVFCCECHEELLHNPVFLPKDIVKFRRLVQLRGLDEDQKTKTREKLAGRIQLLHEVIERGISGLLHADEKQARAQ